MPHRHPLKHNTPLQVIEDRPVTSGGAILSDRIGFLPARQGSGRRNPIQDAVREVQVKQVLRITRFLATSENAVKIQIAVALIAFPLLRLAQAGQKAVTSPLRFARLVRVNLMHRKPLDALLDPEPALIGNPAQRALQCISAKPDSRAKWGGHDVRVFPVPWPATDVV
jgi:hypothetical protein